MAGLGIAASYDPVVLDALLTLPGLLEYVDAEHAADACRECAACPGVRDGEPAQRCVIRLSIERAKVIRASRTGESR